MKYRPFGKLNFQVSALGFGAMRLTMRDGRVDEAETIRMIRYAVDRGVNYVDTAYPYHDGQSEVAVGRALQDGYRERVKLATKMPSWLIRSADDFDTYLNIQMERMQVETVDFYLLHSMNKQSWPRLRALGVLEWAEKAIAAGRFHHLGFSFHDDAETFRQIVDDYDWAMCQIQYNYMDVDNQAGTRGLRYAAAKGIPVVVMEPLLGGKLVDPPPRVQAIWDSAPTARTPAAWGLHWLWNQPEVSLVLSGMSTMEQTEENVALAGASGVNLLSGEELALCEQARVAYQELTAIACTNCRYCLPCPQGVDIPGNLGTYNDGLRYDKPEASRGQYAWWKYAHEVQKIFANDIRAARCIQCGECEDRCPQGIPISSWMPVIHEVLGEGRPYVRRLEP